jgi:hypothetical protein
MGRSEGYWGTKTKKEWFLEFITNTRFHSLFSIPRLNRTAYSRIGFWMGLRKGL